jgi:hypothetical protein
MGLTMAQYVEQRGEERGRAEGEGKGLRQALVVVLEARFGPLPEAVGTAVAKADLDTVMAWLHAAATAASLEAVRITPPTRAD